MTDCLGPRPSSLMHDSPYTKKADNREEEVAAVTYHATVLIFIVPVVRETTTIFIVAILQQQPKIQAAGESCKERLIVDCVSP